MTKKLGHHANLVLIMHWYISWLYSNKSLRLRAQYWCKTEKPVAEKGGKMREKTVLKQLQSKLKK